MAEFVTVATVDEVPPGERIVLEVGDEFVILLNVDGRFYAIADKCTHDDGPLAEGTLDGHVIACPRHGATFDVRTGAALTWPATRPVPRYEVRVVGREVQIALS